MDKNSKIGIDWAQKESETAKIEIPIVETITPVEKIKLISLTDDEVKTICDVLAVAGNGHYNAIIKRLRA